eukprot:1266536-Rhodomonas_salina.2
MLALSRWPRARCDPRARCRALRQRMAHPELHPGLFGVPGPHPEKPRRRCRGSDTRCVQCTVLYEYCYYASLEVRVLVEGRRTAATGT